MGEQGEFRVNVEHHGTSVVLSPVGEVDLGHSPDLREVLQQYGHRQVERMIIDLELVPYMDSSGVATLVEAMQLSRRNGFDLVLCALQPRVRSIFEIAKLDTIFTIVDGREQAHAHG